MTTDQARDIVAQSRDYWRNANAGPSRAHSRRPGVAKGDRQRRNRKKRRSIRRRLLAA